MKKFFALAAIAVAVILSPFSALALDWGDHKADVNYNQQMYFEYSLTDSTFNSYSEGHQFNGISIGGTGTFGEGVKSSVFQAQGHSSVFDIPGGTAYTFSESQTQSWVNVGTPPTFNTTNATASSGN